MHESYDLPDVERFTAGAVGQPGQRTFFLQARASIGLLTLKVEKQQVAALADYLERLLVDLSGAAAEPTPMETGLEEPTVPLWAVGALAVAVEADGQHLVVVAEEMVDEDQDGATARIRLTLGQAATFVEGARRAVAGGRPTCRLCGRPIDQEGHVCPRTNGHGLHP